jgi:hypothetical protein
MVISRRQQSQLTFTKPAVSAYRSLMHSKRVPNCFAAEIIWLLLESLPCCDVTNGADDAELESGADDTLLCAALSNGMRRG